MSYARRIRSGILEAGWRVLAVAGVALLSLGSLSTLADEGADSPAGRMPTSPATLVELIAHSERLQLRPGAGHEPALDPPEVYRTESGATIFGGSIDVEIPDEPFRRFEEYRYSLDLKEGTYGVSTRAKWEMKPESDQVEVRTEAGGYLTCSVGAEIEESDPVYIPTSRTVDTLVWEKGPGHPPCADGSSGQCIPICPTLAYTCWLPNNAYSPAFKHDPVIVPSFSRFQSSQTCHYLNWDFPPPLGDDIPTFVEHYDTITYSAGRATVSWYALESGQAASLLRADITVSSACY